MVFQSKLHLSWRLILKNTENLWKFNRYSFINVLLWITKSEFLYICNEWFHLIEMLQKITRNVNERFQELSAFEDIQSLPTRTRRQEFQNNVFENRSALSKITNKAAQICYSPSSTNFFRYDFLPYTLKGRSLWIFQQ